jgi:hypothetical protein
MRQRADVVTHMTIDWDVPIPMADGTVLRGDVFRPADDGRYPVIASHGRYGKNLTFQEGYPAQWESMVVGYPDTAAGSSNRWQAWEVVDPREVGAPRLRRLAGRLAGSRALAGVHRLLQPAGDA